MKKTVVLREQKQFAQVLKYLDEIPEDELHEVIIRPHKQDIGERQRAYYFVALKAIAAYTGDTVEELHMNYKKEFLVDIMKAHPDDYPNFIEKMSLLRAFYKTGQTAKALRLYDLFVKECSLMDAKRAHVAEYIDSIVVHAADFLQFAVPPAEPDILRR